MQSPVVFFVANDPTVLNGLTDLFKQEKLRSENFSTTEAFLAEFNPERSGCLLLDMSVPGMDAVEFNRKLAQLGSIIPVIILANRCDAYGVMKMLKDGILDLFEKPFDSGALLGAVKHAIEMDNLNRCALRFRAEVRNRFAQLTKREREITASIFESKSSRAIADQLNVSARTVEAHRASVMKKMGAASLVELASMVSAAFGCHCIQKHIYLKKMETPIQFPPRLLY